MKLSDLSAPPGTVVDIIIRAKDGAGLLSECIRSIAQNTPAEQFRLILVDDGSTEPLELAAWMQDGRKLPDISVRCEDNRGAVTATNFGLGIALALPGDYVLILDNDTLIPEGDSGWLSRMVAELEQGGPRCAAVGATTNFANPPQHILTAPATYTHDWQDEDGKRGGRKTNPDVVAFVSFAVLLRKSAISDVGLWDEQYNPGNYEDTDYSVALRTAGYTLRVARSVYIHHVGHQTFKDSLRDLLATNSEKFYAKWGAGRLFDLGLIDPKQLKAAL